MLRGRRGIALILVYVVIVVLVIWGLVFLSRSISERRLAEYEKESLQAFYVAEAGLEHAKSGLYTAFRTYFLANGQDIVLFIWFDSLDDDPPIYDLPTDVSLGEGSYAVVVDGVDVFATGADVVLSSTGTVNTVTRTVTAVIRFGLSQSPVFNYSYFVNNYGWFWGGGIDSNGDVRSNGDFSFGGNPTVNGDIYAALNSELGTLGTISGSNQNDTLSYYENQAPDTARPMDPRCPSCSEYEPGYDGDSERFEAQEPLTMPYLGDLSAYETMAVAEGGTISQGGSTLVNAVYDGNGPDGVPDTPDDGCMVLVGTVANPIEISGPVVINNDVAIRGVVQGQGTIYTGRNVHIIGDITYADAPSWPKPDGDPDTTDQTNNTRDFLGLAAKGNVIVGDYTRRDWTRNVLRYLDPGFTNPYFVDETDADIGYVSGYSGGEPYFDGDYTATDGGCKDNGGGGCANRRYYESSLSNSDIRSIAAPSNQIRNVQAITYTNHAWAGRVGAFTMDGSIIARDEAIIYSGNIDMNYDVRAWEGYGSLDIFLPRSLVAPQVLSWQED